MMPLVACHSVWLCRPVGTYTIMQMFLIGSAQELCGIFNPSGTHYKSASVS